jgi:hypothetical protein
VTRLGEILSFGYFLLGQGQFLPKEAFLKEDLFYFFNVHKQFEF